MLMPDATELPVVNAVVPALIFSAVALPIVFPLIVIEAATPEQLIPIIPPAIAAVGLALVKPPMTLF